MTPKKIAENEIAFGSKGVCYILDDFEERIITQYKEELLSKLPKEKEYIFCRSALFKGNEPCFSCENGMSSCEYVDNAKNFNECLSEVKKLITS